MLAKSKWIILVALVGVLALSGVAMALNNDSDDHTLGLTIDEVASLKISGGSGETGSETALKFTIRKETGADDQGIEILHGTAGTPHSNSVTGWVELTYTSILSSGVPNTSRSITATVDKDWKTLGVEINAEVTTLTAPAAGRGGEVPTGDYAHDQTAGVIDDGGELKSGATTVSLIKSIGSVEKAEAEVTYTVSIENVSMLYSTIGTATPITVTITLNEEVTGT